VVGVVVPALMVDQMKPVVACVPLDASFLYTPPPGAASVTILP
jgi:hypothetical protein